MFPSGSDDRELRGIGVAVVGAGVVGLSAAAELGRRGARVTTFDPEPPGSGQSRGTVRAFRIAHPSVFAVELAVRSLALWREWEEQLAVGLPEGASSPLVGGAVGKPPLVGGAGGTPPLVGGGGLLMADPDRAVWAASMAAAGQPYEFPTRERAARLCPLVAAERLDPDVLLFDPQAGAIDTRGTIEWLLALNTEQDWRLVAEDVLRVDVAGAGEPGDAALVVTAAGEYRFDAVVVAAGAGTEAFAEDLGLHLDTLPQRRTWASLRPRALLSPTAMWMETLTEHRYGWAQLGVDGEVALSGDWSSSDPSDTSAGSFAAAIEYAAELMPALDPATARAEEALVAPVVVPDGLPFAISSVGPVTLVEGNQLFKFAPLLGVFLADSVAGRPPTGVPAFGPFEGR